jgi:hypothetical protein
MSTKYGALTIWSDLVSRRLALSVLGLGAAALGCCRSAQPDEVAASQADERIVQAVSISLKSVHEIERIEAVRRIAAECMGEDLFGPGVFHALGITGGARRWGEHSRSRFTALMPMLKAASQDKSRDVREQVAVVLMYVGEMGLADGLEEPRGDAVEVLWKLAGDDDPRVSLWSARALYCMGVKGPAVVFVSVRLLEHPSSEVRAMAVYNLNIMGRDAAEAVPEIAKRVFDSDERVRIQARQALRQVKP